MHIHKIHESILLVEKYFFAHFSLILSQNGNVLKFTYIRKIVIHGSGNDPITAVAIISSMNV